MLRENMRLIAECSQQLVRLGENLWGKGTTEKDINFDVAVEETIKDISDKVVDTLMGGLMVGKSFNLPQGYVFKDENGNVINATKIVLEKKKKEYPKTFEECVHVLEGDSRMSLEQMNTFRRLIDARNAYWKIAGEEMGLGKPWEPDWSKNESKCTIEFKLDYIHRSMSWADSCILAFPTEEMRDAFYENFKELIEQCKELL